MKFFTRFGAMPAQETIGSVCSDETPRHTVGSNTRRQLKLSGKKSALSL